MRSQAVYQPRGAVRDAFAQPRAESARQWTHKREVLVNGLKGMLAEVLFCMGLLLIGLLISLVGGR